MILILKLINKNVLQLCYTFIGGMNLKEIPRAFLSRLFGVKFYFLNFRITNWRAYLGLSLLPFIENMPEFFTNVSRIKIILISLATISCFLAFTFGLNNCFDIETDINEGDLSKNPIAAGKLSFKGALVTSLLMGFLGVMVLTFLIPFNTIILIYLTLLFLGAFYSAPPFRFKSKPFLDVISHGLFFGSLLYIYGHLLQGTKLSSIITNPLVFLIFTYSVVLNMRNHFEDYKYDLEANISTTATYLGYNKTKKAIFLLIQVHWTMLTIVCLITSIYLFIGILTLFLVSNMLFLSKLFKFEKWLKTIDIFTIISYILLALH